MDAGQLRSLRKAAAEGWAKLSGFRQEELINQGYLALDDYGSPTMTPLGSKALKENP